MTCPGCGAHVADDTAICPACDYIVDTAFLAGDDDAPGDTPPPADSTRVQAAPELEDATPPRGTPVPLRRRRADEVPLDDEQDFAEHPEQLWFATRDFATSLSFADRIAAAGAMALCLSCFLPWRETTLEGELVGLFGTGALAFFAGALQLGLLAARHHGSRSFSDSTLWMAQLGFAGFGVLWCAEFQRTARFTIESEFVGGPDLLSQPSYGVWVALAAAVIALAGSLLHVREGTAPRRR